MSRGTLPRMPDSPGGDSPPLPYARTVTFQDDNSGGQYPLCVPNRVLLDGDDVTGHILPGRLFAPLRQVGRRRGVQPWGIHSISGAVAVWLVVRPETVIADDLSRQITFAGHNLLTPPLPYAIEDLGEVELVPGHVHVPTIAEPWREKALLLRFYAESVRFLAASHLPGSVGADLRDGPGRG